VWSDSYEDDSISSSEATNVSGIEVSVCDVGCSNCSAVTSTSGSSFGANAYGGSMSVLYVGAYAWSIVDQANINSACAATNAIGVSVSVLSAGCINCSAVSSSSYSYGANSYGGSMSVAHIGAYTWSYSNGASKRRSGSFGNATRVFGLAVSLSSSVFRLSRALSHTVSAGYGANVSRIRCSLTMMQRLML
jgi:hypothetical protein